VIPRSLTQPLFGALRHIFNAKQHNGNKLLKYLKIKINNDCLILIFGLIQVPIGENLVLKHSVYLLTVALIFKITEAVASNPEVNLVREMASQNLAPSTVEEPSGECTVSGHGPYSEPLKGCQKLAADQAEANCAMKKKNGKSSFKFIVDKKQKWGSCESQFNPLGSCSPSKCKTNF
jgi:hypothetical protein